MAVKYAEVAFRLPVDSTFTYLVEEKQYVHVGCRVRAPLRGNDKQIGVVTALSDNKPPYEVRALQGVIDPWPLLPPDLLELADWLSGYYLASIGECLAVMTPRGLRIPAELKEPVRQYFEEGQQFEKNAIISSGLKLTAQQQQVLEGLKKPRLKGNDIHLVFGVTGSGKTEIYIRAIEAALAAGRSALLMVPEITLTVQLISRLKKVFGQRLAMLHSYLPVSEKYSNWLRVRIGMADVVVGTRSAVFAPLINPGLIIIDEEHDSSYKEHSAPRYHARQVAYQRIKRHDGKCILGSATPSLESYYWARQKNKIGFHMLTGRATGARMPSVTIVERTNDRQFISEVLLKETERTLDRGEQAIFLLNRRGYSPQAYCARCRQTMICEDCSVTLTYHKGDRLVCHLCGNTHRYRGRCHTCDNPLELVGVGTQQAEEMIEEAFNFARIRRLDQDSVRSTGKADLVAQTLLDLERHEFDLLLGTQMIAKGLDFENITLVAVLNADIGLGLPDFRANERIFALLVQVAGRAGRSQKAGQVIIQTMTPALPLLRQATDQNYEAFFNSEIPLRRLGGYPPYARMIRLVLRSPKEEFLISVCEQLPALLGEFLSALSFGTWVRDRGIDLDHYLKNSRINGPLPAPLYKSHGYYRQHLIIKSTYLNSSRCLVDHLVKSRLLRQAGLDVQVDIDPLDLM